MFLDGLLLTGTDSREHHQEQNSFWRFIQIYSFE